MKKKKKKKFKHQKSEDFFIDPSSILIKTFKFLGLDAIKFTDFEKYNYGNNPKMDDKIRKYLIEYFKPYNQQLYEFLGINFNWENEI